MEIQVKLANDAKLKKEFQIIIPKGLVNEKIENSAKEISKTINIKGFRKGQVPTKVVVDKYGKSIMAEESDKMINEQIRKIVDENKLKIALQPKIDIKSFEEDKDLEVNATFEIFPEVPEIELKKLKLSKKEVKVESQDIQESIDKLLRYFKKWDKQEDSYKAKDGDAVNIDYEGSVDGEKFEGGAAQGHQLELGSKSFIDTFEEQLVGKKAGDEVKVKVKFPKEYHAPNLAGKKAEFKVKVNDVSIANLPEVDDEFIKNNFGLENKAELEKQTEKQILDSYSNLSKNMFKKDLFDLLDKKFSFDLPEGLIEEQHNRQWAQIEQELASNPDKFKNDKEKNKAKDEERKRAISMIKSGIILNEIAQKNKIEVASQDIDQELQKVMQQYPGQEKMVIEYYQKNPEAIHQLRGTLIDDKTVNFIIDNVTLDKKELSIKEFDKQWKKFNEK